MQKTKIAIIGAGGYGNIYLNFLTQDIDPSLYELAGIIDPFAKAAPKYNWLCENNIPIYDTLEEFYRNNFAPIIFIASPIHLHKEQCMTAMKNGSHVLCEKPLVPFLQDALYLDEKAKEYGKVLAVGFQWSYCTPFLKLKADILKGEFGKPLRFRSFVSWKRYDAYYNSPWKAESSTRRVTGCSIRSLPTRPPTTCTTSFS